MTLRNRLGLASLLVSAAILFVAGWFVLHNQRAAALATLDDSLDTRLDDLAALDEQNAIPFNYGISAAEDTLAMVIAPDGAVRLTTDAFGDPAELLNAVEDLRAPITTELTTFGETRGIDEMRLDADRAPDGSRIVVGQSLAGVNDTVTGLRRTLLLVAPVLAIAAALLTRTLVGRALVPVETIRTEADEISLTDLHRRIPTGSGANELDALAGSLNGMLSRLEVSADAQRRLVADVAHELRSPLAALVTQLEVGLTHPDTADWPATAAESLDEGRRLQALIDNLLLLARLDAHETPDTLGLVDLDELIHDTARRTARNQDIAIDRSNVGAGVVRGDADQLQRCIQNVLDNAVRYADTTVTVTLREHDDKVELAVTDDGPGIPTAERTQVFERFYRISDSRDRASGGTGIGLAIVKELVELHAGTVEATPAEPTGTMIVMRFPSADAPSRDAIRI